MAFFGFRAYPTPIVKPMWPFFIAAGVVFYGVNKLQDMAVSTEEASKDPRNPYGKYRACNIGQKVLKAAHH